MATTRRLGDEPVLVFASSSEARAWFKSRHARQTEQWIGYWKKGVARPGASYVQVLDEALCFGWIDGLVRTVDAECYANRWTPRKPGGTWSAANVRRMGELLAAGRVQATGRRAWEARDAQRTADEAHARREAALAPAQEKVLRARARAWAWWSRATPAYRRQCAWWVNSAKRDATRASRLATLVDCCARGEKIPPLAERPAR